MLYRNLGTTDIKVSTVGLGGWGLDGGQIWRKQDRATSVAVVHAALDAGINLIDTAPAYGKGYSERLIGEAVMGRRDKVILATKFGLRWEGKTVYKKSTPESIRWEVEQSLIRLQTDYIDLYQCHWPDGETAEDEIGSVVSDLIQQGKVRAAGVSNFTISQIETFRHAVDLASLQPRLSILDRESCEELLPWCAQHNVGVLTYGSLAGGLLSGKYTGDRKPRDSRSRFYPHFREPEYSRALQVVEVIAALAEVRGVRPAQIAIAWVLSHTGVTSALVGARRAEQATENAGASEMTLSAEEEGAIRDALEAQSL